MFYMILSFAAQTSSSKDRTERNLKKKQKKIFKWCLVCELKKYVLDLELFSGETKNIIFECWPWIKGGTK
jgi:hypothetical protein